MLRRLFLVVCALLIVTLLGCSSDAESIDVDPEQPSTPVKILALGDSYTVGEQVDKLDAWPGRLVRSMRVDGRSVAEPKIVAATGWSSTDLIQAIQLTDLQVTFDVVTLQIGVYNQFRQSSIADFERDLAELTNIAVDLSGGVVGRVVLVSIPDWSVTPFAEGAPKQQIAGEIDEFNDVIRAHAGTLGAYFVDITQTSRRAANEPDLIAGDGLHPSGNMYAEWVGLIQPVVEEIID